MVIVCVRRTLGTIKGGTEVIDFRAVREGAENVAVMGDTRNTISVVILSVRRTPGTINCGSKVIDFKAQNGGAVVPGTTVPYSQ